MSGKKGVIPSVYEVAGLMYFWCESEFFPGGEREAGPIDLTVQRNSKGIPYVRGSSVKGAIRSFYEVLKGEDEANVVFGSTDKAGCVVIGNAEILAFPVKADRDLFLYVTSPSQISAYAREADRALGLSVEENWNVSGEEAASASLDGEVELMDGRYTLKLRREEKAERLAKNLVDTAVPKVDGAPAPGYGYLKSKLEKLVVVEDGVFRELVNNGLVVVLRIALERSTKTAAGKAMFYQELIPEGTLLFAPLMKAIRLRKGEEGEAGIVDGFVEELKRGYLLNLGGDETTGKGVVRVLLCQRRETG